ncbi:hypothetical protein ACNKHS_11350 [Shigella flexneri]
MPQVRLRLRTTGSSVSKVQFGDYRANGVMAVARNWACRRDSWLEHLTHLDLTGIASKN